MFNLQKVITLLDKDGRVMRELMHITRKRSIHLLGACVLLGGGVGVSVLMGAAGAQAATCGTDAPAGVSCLMTGTAVLGAGNLNLTPPNVLGWGGSVTGTDQALADTTGAGADETYVVNDATGSGAGWHVTASATTFTSTTPAATLATSAFQTNGSAILETDTTTPTTACSAATACTLPTDTTVYPVDITTAAVPTAFTIYDASANTGLGSVIIGGVDTAQPVGWWLNVPANTLAGTYTSTVTMAIIAAP
jgi:WxL domain surface cell wall-binding